MASITNSGSDVISRQLVDGVTHSVSHNLEKEYEVSRCVQWIQEGRFKKVGLQFPDEVIVDAPGVARAINEALGFCVYILGDTTYGSCCVDEVAAEHVGADAIIHFGRSCLSPSKRLPVLYVFTKMPVQIQAVVEGINCAIEDKSTPLIFLYDTRCYHAADDVMEKLRENFPKLLGSKLLLDQLEFQNPTCCNGPEEGTVCCNTSDSGDHSVEDDNCLVFNGRCVCLPDGASANNYQFIYLGPNGPTLTCLSMKFSDKMFHNVNPSDGSVTVTSGIKSVMSRSGKLEMAKDAEIIGVLVGTLGVADYREVISRLKAIIKGAGKRCYTFVVGKPNEPKLANISEVDIFVYVACPETSIVERSVDPVLYRKILTPWELEVALTSGQEWSLDFESDFRQLLPGGRRHVEITNGHIEEEVSVSLISNKTQRIGIREEEEAIVDSTTGAVVLRDGMALSTVHVGGGGQVLQSRTWQGLDPSTPAPAAVGVVLEGRKGIASVYQDESQVES